MTSNNNGSSDSASLASAPVNAFEQETQSADLNPPLSVTRSITNMREEREDLREALREAAEQTLNVIADIDLGGRVKWVSPSWRQVVGTPPESVEGRIISDITITHKDAFHNAIESMKEDDSHSRFVRFSVQLGPDSVLKKKSSSELRPRDECPDASATSSS